MAAEHRSTARGGLLRRLGPARIDRAWIGCLLIIGIGTLIRLPQVVHSLAGRYAFRQTQTAFTIREYAANGVDLFSSPLPVFGTADSVPFEFPLFQAIARELMRLGITDSTAGRLTGLITFQIAALLCWMLLRRWHGETVALVTLVGVQALPFSLHWGATSLIDWLSLALGLATVLCFDSWLTARGRRTWPTLTGAIVFAWLLFVVKVTTVPLIGMLLLLSVGIAVLDRGWAATWKRALIGLAAAPGSALLPLVLWTRHADATKERWAATEFLTSANTRDFLIGHSRFDGNAWRLILDRVEDSIAGPMCIALVVGLIAGLVLGSPRVRLLIGGLAVAALAPVLIFFNLYVVHIYYQIAVFPLLVAIIAIGWVELSRVLLRRSRLLVVVPALATGALVLTTMTSPQGEIDVDDLVHGVPVPELANQIRRITPPDARLAMADCDWDPEMLYFAHRTGLMLRGTGQDLGAVWKENRIADYRYVAQCRKLTPLASLFPEGTKFRRTRNPYIYRIVAPPG